MLVDLNIPTLLKLLNIRTPKKKLMVPRQTYFPLITDRVQKAFAEYVSVTHRNNEIWLDYNGTPLKWYTLILN